MWNPFGAGGDAQRKNKTPIERGESAEVYGVLKKAGDTRRPKKFPRFDEDAFNEGTIATIHATRVVVPLGGREAELVTKRFKIAKGASPEDIESIRPYARITFNTYRLLKKAGLRVPPTYRFDEENVAFVMTNYNSKGNITLSANRQETSPGPDRKIKNIANLSQLLEAFKKECILAGKSNIRLKTDCFFLIIPEKGGKIEAADFVIGDLDYVDAFSNSISEGKQKEFIIENLKRVKSFWYLFIKDYGTPELQAQYAGLQAVLELSEDSSNSVN